jgi:high-affinity iron transporter
MMRTWLRLIEIVVFSLIVAAAVASISAAAQDAQALFEQRCAACHGPTGMGDGPAAAALQPPPQPFRKALKIRDDAWIAKIISKGGPSVGLPPSMPAFSSLKDDQVKELVEYIKGLGH